MNEELKARWVAALRSGKYRQGRGSLVSASVLGQLSYCCLGVACEIFHKELDVRKRYKDGEVYFDNNNHYLPNKISNTLKMGIEMEMKLANLNDVKNENFHEIADWIERNL